VTAPNITNPNPPYSKMKNLTAAFLCLLVLVAARAVEPSPYAGEQARTIKALSEGDIAQLLNGHGMGLARAAELNSYPGPRHVLDLADELHLDSAQVTELNRLFDGMKAAALPLGRALVDRETELDRLFTEHTATAEKVLALTREIGRLQGELRAVHLNTHVATVAVLRPHQVARYDVLRGYAANTPAVHDPAQHHP
jgi:hypothetical protein